MDKEFKEFLTVKQVAELLQVKPLAVYHLTYRRQIPFLTIGRTKRFDKSKIMDWLNSNSYDIINSRKQAVNAKGEV
jgi:excisionase family DNA binding protein